MVWFRDYFYWLPCNGSPYGDSVRLSVSDRDIELEMNTCKAKTHLEDCPEDCEFDDADCENSHGCYMRHFSLIELKEFRDAINKVIEYEEKEASRIKNLKKSFFKFWE